MTGRYVAVLDTGGISYSGNVYVAVGTTGEAAQEAVARRFLKDRRKARIYDTLTLRTPQDVRDWYGIKVAGPIEDDAAIWTEW